MGPGIIDLFLSSQNEDDYHNVCVRLTTWPGNVPCNSDGRLYEIAEIDGGPKMLHKELFFDWSPDPSLP